MPNYRFADLYIQMSCQYEIMQRRSKKYEVSNTLKEDFTLDIPESLMSGWKKKYPQLTFSEIELILMGSQFSAKLLSYNGFVLHASAIEFFKKGILFSASSGVGKSTHTKLWQQHFGINKVAIINDDKPAIRYIDGTFYVYGTPFSGNSEENINCKTPLHAIVFLEQSATNSIHRLTSAQAIPLILQHTLRPKNSALYTEQLLSYLDKLLVTIPCYLLKCNMEDSAVELVSNQILDDI